MELTKEEIIQNNKLIAACLGGEVKEIYRIRDTSFVAWCGDVAKHYRHEKMKIRIGDCIDERQLEFHSSWDWLMEAWKKVGSILYKIRGDLPKDKYILAHTYTKCFLDACQVANLSNAYTAVLECVKLINEQHDNITESSGGNEAL